jgi:hypothetical protein
MSLPTTRADFKEWCLRELGKGAIKINVTDEQVDDRIDEALQYYWDYHFDGTEKMYYKHQITSDDKTNKYITIPENIIGAVSLFPLSSGLSTSDMFNIRYQIALNDLYTLTNSTVVPFYMTMQHLAVLEEIFVGRAPLRYNRHRNQLWIDMNWDKVNVGEYVVVECYQIVDPDDFPNVWKDRWLLKYATAKIKRQWGTNLKKFTGMSLPGGVQFSGQTLYDEAQAEIEKMEEEMIMNYSMPVLDMVG